MSDATHAILAEAARLAREAENAGVGPQGARLGKIASHVAAGRFEQALAIRDEIRADLDAHRQANLNAGFLMVGLVIGAIIMGFLIWNAISAKPAPAWTASVTRQ